MSHEKVYTSPWLAASIYEIPYTNLYHHDQIVIELQLSDHCVHKQNTHNYAGEPTHYKPIEVTRPLVKGQLL